MSIRIFFLQIVLGGKDTKLIFGNFKDLKNEISANAIKKGKSILKIVQNMA